MPLSWNEIRARAVEFSTEWKDDSSENAEAKSFWDAFFTVFGISRRRVASFEKPVRQPDGRAGYIDLLWKATLLVEHKSRGKDLDRAFHQATDYFYGLKERDLPRYILVSDFARFRLYDLDAQRQHEFPLKDLHKNIKRFGFIAGYQAQRFEEQEEAASIKAAEKLGKLHDQLQSVGYEGHPLEVLLVRLLFCLFADDTGIFEKNQFKEYLEQRTSEDGADFGMHLAQLFEVLNTPTKSRLKNLDEQLHAFTYVNGRLFQEALPIPAFGCEMRETLLDACALDWSRISPAIFGSLFQSIKNVEARRNLGAHYTREHNILKALRPLFLDTLDADLSNIGSNGKRLIEFQKQLAEIRILDPACGCGNFLVIAYRELRKLELQVLHRLYEAGKSNRVIDVKSLVFVDVDQLYGIEIEEFPAQIAQVALWLTDHQMNLAVSEEFGQYFARLPLTKSPNVAHGNALRLDWKSVCPHPDFIVGNPPFVGKHYRSPAQRDELLASFPRDVPANDLDYVAAWYAKAAEVIQNTKTRCAFVSTNSLTQGEQVPVLWPYLFSKGIHIQFAHRTFEWTSEAKGRAAVHCVIIGFGLEKSKVCRLMSYESGKGEPHELLVPSINAYLTPGPNVIVTKRQTPLIEGLPTMRCGNKPTDGGHLLLTPQEKDDLLRKDPAAAKFVRRFIGSEEYLNGIDRYCLWLEHASPTELRQMPQVMQRVEAVRAFRLNSTAAPTRRAAQTPTRFFFQSQPSCPYIVIPEVSSERRQYVPIGFMSPDVVTSNKNYVIAEANLYLLGLLQSAMHMAWMRTVAGRLKSDYQYSATMVYNTFPFPERTKNFQNLVEQAEENVLDARLKFPTATLADLYDPIAMPPELSKAHQELDRAVDAAYGIKALKSEEERMAFLFERYQKLAAPIEAATTQKKPRSKAGPKSARRLST